MAKASLAQRLSSAWYQGHGLLHVLRPLSALFTYVAARRRKKYSHAPKSASPIVVVVGNIAVGGTGKTPLIIALVHKLREQGWRPGVISRGYGSNAPHYPYTVNSQSPVAHCGDEPLLIAQQCDCPVVIDAQRNNALALISEQHDCDIVLSDDGLQHYQLARHIEFAVLDGSRGLGNGYCLPAGPLREPAERLNDVDFVLINQSPGQALHPSLESLFAGQSSNSLTLNSLPSSSSYTMSLGPVALRNLHTLEKRPCNKEQLDLIAQSGELQAIAGIGNPQRFFDSLRGYGLSFDAMPFDDHQSYDRGNLSFAFHKPVLMTAKDGVKCTELARHEGSEQWWQLDVEAQLPEPFWTAFFERLQNLSAESLSSDGLNPNGLNPNGLNLDSVSQKSQSQKT